MARSPDLATERKETCGPAHGGVLRPAPNRETRAEPPPTGNRIRDAQESGDAAPGIDASCEAQALLAVAKDLGGDILLDSRTVGEALTLLDYYAGKEVAHILTRNVSEGRKAADPR